MAINFTGSYSQNFDTLAPSGTSSVLPSDWVFLETGTNANTLYTAGTGSGNTGDTYSFGATGNSDRALGTLRSGSLSPLIGASFTNHTGSTITSLTVSYTGEQWRLGTAGRADRLDFQYSLDATSLSTGIWADVNTLDFSSSITTGTVGLLDGNASANRTVITATISGLNIAPGATFWFRWQDFDASGADDGLAIDDFSLTATVASPLPTVTITAIDPDAAEAGQDPGTFRITRSGSTTGDLTVNYTIEGQATNGTDYNNLMGIATITDGQSFVDITITPNDDLAIEGNETVTLTLTDAADYDLGTAITSTVTIADNDTAPVPTDLFISEYVEGSSNNKALEFFNGTGTAIDLAAGQYVLQMYFNGNTTAGLTIELTGTVAAGDVFVLAQSSANAAILAQADQTNGASWYNGDDAIVLRKGGATGTIIDVIGQVGFDPGTEWGTGLTSTADNTLRRKTGIITGDTNPADAFDPAVEWDGFATDTFDGLGSPGNATAPRLSLSVAPGSFSEAAGANAAIGTVTRTGSSTNDLIVTLASNDTSEATVPTTVTILAGQTSATFAVSAVDDAMIDGSQTVTLTAAAAGFSNATANVIVADDEVVNAITKINQIQGSGSTFNTAFGGTQTIEGVVVGAFNGLSGFYVQEEDADWDSDDTTSEGIFVFDPTGLFSGSVGSKVRITGTVGEFTSSSSNIAGTGNSSLTQLSNLTTVVGLGTVALPTVTNVVLPVADASVLERYEGMLVNISSSSGSLVVTETFKLGRFGQVGLSGGDRLGQYTQFNAPSVNGYANYLANLQDNYIILDDGRTTQNPDPVIHARGGQPLSATNTLRGGDTIANISGVLDQRFEGYRVQSTTPANFQPTNPRAATAPVVGGTLRIASANLLNFFNGNGIDANNDGLIDGGFPTSRGADTAIEFKRQIDKTVQEVLGLNADVFGYNEMENDGYGPTSAVQELVDALNAATAPGTYAFVIPPASALNASGGFGGDEITVGFIYKTDAVRVAPGTNVAALTTGIFDQVTTRVQRPSLAVTFERLANGTPTSETFTAVINHFKSKGSAANLPGDADQNDGQGLSNATRTRAAQELAAWLATNPTGTLDPDYLIMGDLNSYRLEDPITTLTNAGYNSLFGPESYSYQFNGQWGSLDHALANASMSGQVTGAAKWHINSDEPTVLDYNTEFKTANQVNSFYNVDPFRTSDHDPIVVGLNLTSNNAAPTAVNLINPISTLLENISTVTRIKVADISITDDAFGTNTLSLSGADAGFFEIDGSALYLKAGTILDFETKPNYGITVNVDDPTVGSTPDASATYTLTLQDQPFESVDLSNYVRIGRYNLPEPTRTSAPAGSLLAQEVSAVTYNWDTDTLFVVGDGGRSIVQVNKRGQFVDSMTLAAGSSPQGTEFYDTEGLTYIGNGQFVLVEERYRQANLFTYNPSATLNRSDVQTVKLGTTVGNIGLEGISYDPLTNGFIAVKEVSPQGIFQTRIDFAAGTATNGSPTTINSTNLFDPALANLLDFSDVFALSNLSSLAGTPDYSRLLIVSQESGQIINLDRNGSIASSLTIASDPGNPLSVADQGFEGVTMDRNGFLYITSEEGGGDVNHPQLWVYAPTSYTYTNQAPTAVSLANATTVLAENTSTTNRIKVGNIVVSDDAKGTNNLFLSGTDVSFFEISGTELFLKAGTTLDYETKTSYNVTVNVNDPTVGGNPDASTNFTLSVTDLSETPSPVTISEVAPWSSGNSAVSADWFELTNTTSSAVDITGWRMDDDSNSFATSVALNGVTSIAAGESVIFLETSNLAATKATFLNVWFGGVQPTGLQFGSYSGSGVGLSTGSDAVNLFNAAGIKITGIRFGASTTASPFRTFDNATGLQNSTIATLSTVDVNGAFSTIDGASSLIGSPGRIVNRAPIALDDTATTNEDTTVIFNSLTNDSDPDNNPLTITEVNGSAIVAGNSVALASGALLTLNADKTFSYTPNGKFESLTAGQNASDSFTYTVSDGKGGTATATVNVAIAGVNDAAGITGNAIGTVTEDLDVVNGNLTATGLLTVTDADAGEAKFQIGVTSANGNLGSLSITDAGAWSYSVANSAAQSLGTGQTKVDTFTVQSLDGSASQNVNVTVIGVNDAPVLSVSNPSLTPINQSDTSNSGQTVASFIGPSISDVDAGAREGIAITGWTRTSGTWQYNTGSGWRNVGDVSNGNALLLRDTDLIRFIPSGTNFTNPTLTYRAWDQTSGVAGTKVRIATTGGTSAFSTATDTVQIAVGTRQFGGSGPDLLIGNSGPDYLDGGTGGDILSGRQGDDILIGGAGIDYLVGGDGADVLTGGLGVDVFYINNLTESLLDGFDRITDLQIGTDYISGPYAVRAANVAKLGGVTGLTASEISTVLTSGSFRANGAATFTYNSRTFLALNNGVAGFSANTDAILEITGYSGNLNNLAIV